MVYFPCKRLIAHILLLGQILTSCGNPRYLRMARIDSYGTSSSNSTPFSTICRVSHASSSPIPLPSGSVLHFYQKGSSCWAALMSSSAQPVDLPVRFSDGFTTALLAKSDPVWQKQYIHLHLDSSDNLHPYFVYIGPSAPSLAEPLSQFDSTAHLASGFTPSSVSSACSYTFHKTPGYKIVLEPYGNRWQAMVHDNRFVGLSCSYPAVVRFVKGYCLEDFITNSPAYQSHHIQLGLTDKDGPVVYIGATGLKGGSRCPKCKYFIWPCYGCGIQLCGCCATHCNKYAYGVCSAKETIMQQQQQELWNAQAKRNRLNQDQEASAQWEKEEQSRQAVQAAQESRISQELASVKSKHASAYLKRAKERRTRESIRQGIEIENIKSRLRCQGDVLLHEKDISLTDSEAEEDLESTTTTNKIASFDTNYYQLSDPSTSRVSKEAPLLPTPLGDSESEEECALSTTTNKTASFNTSNDPLLAPSTSKLSDNELLVAPPVVDTFSFIPHFINQNKGLSRFCADSSSGYVSGVSSNSISEDATQEFPEDFLSASDSIALSGLQSTNILKKYSSLSSLVCAPTYRPLPLRRSLSLESFLEQPNFQASILQDSSLDPISRFLAYYSYYLSSEDAVIFYAQAGKYISEKLPKSSSEVQQGVLNYFLDGGDIYPTILAKYPASDWLLHSLWHELAKDPIGDPLSLETFQEYWVLISEKYTKDQQTSLLQSLWQSKKKKQLSLARINDILDLILSTNTQGDELSYNEPLLDQLIGLRNYWLRAKLGDLPHWSPDSSACKQIADVLASSHLSINFIDDLLNQLKSSEEIDLSSLLSFLTFVKSQEVPEAILSKIISSDHFDQLNNPRSWLTSLAVQWLSMHLSQKDPNIPSSLFSSFYKKFDQDISVVPAITNFVIQHRSLVASNSSTFTSVLDLLYTYQASSDLCCSVLESLPNCVPNEWVNSSDKLITDQLFFSSPPYSVEALIDQIVQKSPNCLQNTLSNDTTISYTHLASHMLERVCRQHVVKSLQPCLESELKFLKELYYFAINTLIEKENRLHDKLDELRKEKRKAYQVFDQLKSKHDSKITTIDIEKSDIIAQLDTIDKEEKEELSKTKKKEEELTKELGDKAKEKPKQPEVAQDNTTAKETKKQQLQSRLRSLNQQRSDLQVSFKESEIAYENEQAKLEKEEEDLTDSLASLEADKQVWEKKVDKLSKVSINNFDDWETYNELLESLCHKINDPNLKVRNSFLSSSSVNLKDKKISTWTREDLGIWASSLPKVIKSGSSFSRHSLTIIAAIKRAIALSPGTTRPIGIDNGFCC